MSEFSEPHAIAKLIGAPPGYIGHDKGGLLVDRIRAMPYAVVLFDEVEKAHSAVHTLFLQMFDEAALTDGRGRRASFADAVIIMTSNLGAARPLRAAIGFGGGDQKTDSDQDGQIHAAVESAFLPELRNRIQRVVIFHPLRDVDLERILDLLIRRLITRLSEKRIRLEIADGARRVLLDAGHPETFGARALERAVAQLIEEPLAGLIVSGGAPAGSLVCVVERGARLDFEVRPTGTVSAV
jgi:ATP-dependent Clp protease ATP-binding subunit ClpB